MKYLTIRLGIIFIATMLFVQFVKAQQLPDSVVIIKTTFVAFDDSVKSPPKKFVFTLIDDDYVSDVNRVSSQLIINLLKETNDLNNRSNSLDRYKVDTNWIKNNPDKVLAMASSAKYYKWNKQQKTLINEQIATIKYYDEGLARYLDEGCCYNMHNYYRYNYVLRLYRNGQLIKEITSRKFIWGYRYPWTDATNNKLYTIKIETILDELLGLKTTFPKPLTGNKLLKKLIDYVLMINSDSLHKLAPYTYISQIKALSPTFTISSFAEMPGYGGYHGDPVIQVILKSPEMLPNVSLEFLASQKGGHIYTTDSVKNGYKNVVKRVQAIKFIKDYLAANPQVNLHVLYFDNRPINSYNIDRVNRKPEQWKKHDAYVKSLDWYKTSKIVPSFDLAEAIKVSERNDCGCNYRFTDAFIENGIVFIMDDEEKNHSRWLLLPDDTVLLYMTEGKKVLGHETASNFEYPCTRFDLNGNIIPKPTNSL